MGHMMKSKFFDEVGAVPHDDYYPRPQLERSSFYNLNGTWEYAIYPSDQPFQGYQGNILVPFSPEALLSGVGKIVTPTDTLYYRRNFVIEEDFLKDKTLLHFGAVDYECEVFLNHLKVGYHQGGFFAFTLDISKAIQLGNNIIELIVKDPSDTSYHARGKQSSSPAGIFYTPQSGIWQTVWMESVPENYVEDLRIVPDIDQNEVRITVETKAPEVTVKVLDEGNCIAEGKGQKEIVIPLEQYECWSPENPKLYDLEITADQDTVKSYFGMRKFGVGPDANGKQRLLLNNKPYFHNGVLDQGYWSDGMLTPPTKSAMEYDIHMLKSMGFNMIRKHIKIEPLYWYYLCDKEGMLVWQDMVNGGTTYNPLVIAVLPFLTVNLDDGEKNYKIFGRADEAGRNEYVKDLYDTMHQLINVVSLAMWVPFNEGWGQFDANKISEMVAEYDPTRTIDRTSGWHDQKKSDFVTRHIYFTPVYVPKDDRCYLLDEFGGFSKMTKGHMFRKLLFGYRMYFTNEALMRAYEKIFEKRIIRNIPKGLSATVFTQVSDVEGEINGLITYDRKVEKLDRARVKAVNDRVKL